MERTNGVTNGTLHRRKEEVRMETRKREEGRNSTSPTVGLVLGPMEA